MRIALILGLMAFIFPAFLNAQDGGKPEETQRLIAVLKADGKLEEKHAACQQLAAIGTAEAVPALAALLGDEKLGQPARNALENIPGPEAAEALRAALTKLQGRPLIGVINSIGTRRDSKAIEPLAALLSHKEPDVVATAALSLGKIGTPEAGKALCNALSGAPDATRSLLCRGCMVCAETAMGRTDTETARKVYDLVRASQSPKHFRLAAIRGALVARGTECGALLTEQLKDDDNEVFSAALHAAQELSCNEVTTVLSETLPKLPAARQTLVLRALGHRGDGKAVPGILSFAAKAPVALRVEAIHALAQLGGAAALPKLVEWAAAPDAEVAKAAQAAVASFPAEEASAAIASLLSAKDAKTRVVAIQLVGSRRIASAAPDLVKALSDAEEQVRLASLQVLSDLAGSNELPPLLDLLTKSTSSPETTAAEKAIAAICKRADDRATCVDKVTARYATAPESAKRPLLNVLSTVGGPKALAIVRSATTDPKLKEQAFRMLCDWPTADALPELFKLARSSDDAKLKILGLRGCLRLIPKQDVAAEKKVTDLKEALGLVQRPDEKKLALAALSEVPHLEAAQLIEKSLADKPVQAEAELALLGVCQQLAGTHPVEVKAMLTKLVTTTKNNGLKKKASRLLRQAGKGAAGHITTWQVSGPFAKKGQDGKALYGIAFAPEKPAAHGVKWKSLPPAIDRDGAMILDLSAACGAGENRLAYVRTWISSEKEQPATLSFGTDDGNKVWLNGKLVHGNPEGGAATPDKYKANVALKKGWNALLMKVTQYTGPWEFCFRICQRDGAPLPRLKTQAHPPGSAPAAVAKPTVTKNTPAEKPTPLPEPGPDGWITLFNGKDLTGWDAKPGWWRVEDGALTSESTKEKPCKRCNYLIWKGGKPGDFELVADFKINAKGNSGIQIRSETRPQWDTSGYQADFTGDGKLVGFVYQHKRGLVAGRGQKVTINAAGKKDVQALGDPKELLKAFKMEDWNTYRIVCKGPEITLYINGVKMCQFEDHDKKHALPNGIIALQMHPGPPMKVQFKNMKLRELK